MKWSSVGPSSQLGEIRGRGWFTILLILSMGSYSLVSAVFFVVRSGEIVAQSFQCLLKNFDPCQHKILLIQPLLLLDQYVVGNVIIHPCKINCMEHGWNPIFPELKITMEIINQLVLPIKYNHPVVIIFYGYLN